MYWSLRNAVAVFDDRYDAAIEAEARVVTRRRASGDAIGLAEALSGLVINRPDRDPARSRARRRRSSSSCRA